MADGPYVPDARIQGDANVPNGNAGIDSYHLYGDPASQGASKGPQQADGPPGASTAPGAGKAPVSEVSIGRGQNLWKPAQQVYNGHDPLEAIYQVNGMHPKSVKADGHIELDDPKYGEGKYKMPAAGDIKQLTGDYRKTVAAEGGYSRERVGSAEEPTKVKLIFGDTFDKLSQVKYGKHVPVEAIYEANGLKGQIVDNNGKSEMKEPTYFAGKSYVLPPESQIAELTHKYWAEMGHPELAPTFHQGNPGGPLPAEGQWHHKDGMHHRGHHCATLPPEQRLPQQVVQPQPVVPYTDNRYSQPAPPPVPYSDNSYMQAPPPPVQEYGYPPAPAYRPEYHHRNQGAEILRDVAPIAGALLGGLFGHHRPYPYYGYPPNYYDGYDSGIMAPPVVYPPVFFGGFHHRH